MSLHSYSKMSLLKSTWTMFPKNSHTCCHVVVLKIYTSPNCFYLILKNMSKRTVPRVDPCGTPHLRGAEEREQILGKKEITIIYVMCFETDDMILNLNPDVCLCLRWSPRQRQHESVGINLIHLTLQD